MLPLNVLTLTKRLIWISWFGLRRDGSILRQQNCFQPDFGAHLILSHNGRQRLWKRKLVLFFFCFFTILRSYTMFAPKMAWLALFYYFHSMETLDHAIFCAWLDLSYHLMPKNHLNIATFAFADGGNRTRAPSAASNHAAIHYTIAPRLHVLFVR